MPSRDLTVSRGDDQADMLKAHVEARLSLVMEQASLELGEVPIGSDRQPFHWEVFAFGPWQGPPFGSPPERIIKLGETAFIATVVWLNDFMCTTMAGFEGKVQLSYWTSNLQKMTPVPAMDYTCWIPITVTGCPFFVHVWEFKPTEAASILETNICARICNCNDHVVPGYAGFARWVQDFDVESLWPAGPKLDCPIRYLIYND